MNGFKLKNVFCKDTLSLLSVILFVSVLLTGSAIAAEPPIINGKTKMSLGAQQVLSIMNNKTGNTYTWSKLSGGESLSANSGHNVIYTAPISNPNCASNLIIQMIDSDGNIGSIQIAINACTASDTAFTVLKSTYHLPKAVSVGR